MEKALLEYYLDQGLSLPQIGVLVDRDASTVGYWVQKHGLVANGRAKFAPRGGLSRVDLEPLVNRGLSLREIAKELDVSPSTVKHWLTRFGLSTRRRRRLYRGQAKPQAIEDLCPRHGMTTYVLEGSNAFRCKKCLPRTLLAGAER